MDHSTHGPTLSAVQHEPRLYVQTDVTSRCRLSRSHLYNLIERGQFPAPVLRLGPKFTRWASQDVDDWVRDPQGWIDRNCKGVPA